jgi:hypothetical protein
VLTPLGPADCKDGEIVVFALICLDKFAQGTATMDIGRMQLVWNETFQTIARFDSLGEMSFEDCGATVRFPVTKSTNARHCLMWDATCNGYIITRNSTKTERLFVLKKRM